MKRKLVRDRIPELFADQISPHSTYQANEIEFFRRLREKLQEEVDEFLESETMEEIADICEVLHALAQAKGFNWEEVEACRLKKLETRGAFSQRYIIAH